MSKSNMEVDPFRQLQQAAATADGVSQRRAPSLGAFRTATASTVAAAQNTELPNAVASEGDPLPEAAHAPAPVQDSTAPASLEPKETETHAGQVGVEFEVDLDLLHVLPENSRFDYSEQEVDDMVAAFEREGKQLKAIELTPHDTIPGQYYVLDGETRKRGLRKWGKTKARAVVVEVKGAWERYKASWYANNGSRHTSDYDNGMRWRDMIDRGEISQPVISVTLGEKYSQATVSRVLTINKFPEACKNYIRDHKTKLSSGFYYSAYGLLKDLEGDERKEEQVLDVLTMAVEEDLSARVFEERIDKIVKGREAAGNNSASSSSGSGATPVALLFAGREVGKIKEWAGQDRLEISMKKVPAELRDKIKDAVNKIFADAGLPDPQAAG
jgi:ParB family chromosome partitioning protein